MAGERLEAALKMFREKYRRAGREERSRLLDAFCALTKYHRKYAIALLRRPHETAAPKPRRRGPSYSPAAVRVLAQIWEAADYPWSVRLKALLPNWLPYAKKHLRGCTPKVEEELLRMSARQMDRRLADKKRKQKRKFYGRTKPGTLLKHSIPIKTHHWEVDGPGYCEIDLVSHSGPCASGDFLYSLNLTDIHTGWCETRAIKGKGEAGVVAALDSIRRTLPFRLRAIDSDNGSEFINYHLVRYCEEHGIEFTRGRPYKKDDNAHIEQKNWTHVRRIFGWERYDTPAERDAMNALYEGPLRLMMNLFQPCVKLREKTRCGSRLQRRYDAPRTPLERLLQSGARTAALLQLQQRQTAADPFLLAQEIDRGLGALRPAKRQTRELAM